MPVPDEIRTRLSAWCAARVPGAERRTRQIGYTTAGREVTIVDRVSPTYPELGAEWSTTPVARLCMDDPQPGRWSLYRPVGEAWERVTDGDDPLLLLDEASC